MAGLLILSGWIGLGCGDDGGGTNQNDNLNDNQGPLCGNGTIEGAEACDDGAANSDSVADACRTSCVEASCGDGVVDTLEGCDEGAANSDLVPDACRADCQPARCGDGVVDVRAGETCDCGEDATAVAAGCGAENGAAGSLCSAECLVRYCGNGTVDPGEDCDDGNLIAGDGCGQTCRVERCGNGFVDVLLGEQCDDGNFEDLDGCSSTCRVEVLGWSVLPTLSAPILRHAMVYVHAWGRPVLFGGATSASPAQALGHTWEHDGKRWVRLHPTSSPAPRFDAAMALDSDRQRVVLFGGCGAVDSSNACSSPLDDTWEFDGVAWLPLDPAHSPGPRHEAVMVYDSARQRMVLVGGFRYSELSETWVFDGSDWTQVVGLSPPGGKGSAAAYDEVRDRVVVFGGCGNTFSQSCLSMLGSTWEFDGSAWSELTLGGSTPSARWQHSLTYDSVGGAVLLFGGQDGTGYRNDLWSFDGTTWTELGVIGPTARREHAAAFDTAQGRLLVSAGRGDAGVFLSDLHAFAGTAWTELGTAPQPGVRAGAGLAHDAGRDRLVLFGGCGLFSMGGCSVRRNDTWEFDGAGWEEVDTADRPSGSASFGYSDLPMTYATAWSRVVLFESTSGSLWEYDGVNWTLGGTADGPLNKNNTAIAYDEARAQVVLFGGGMSGETWVYDGVEWALLTPATSPGARNDHGMTYDPQRGTVLLFGGEDIDGAPLDDTWEFDGSTWALVTSPLAPSERARTRPVYDTTRERTLLYGGLRPINLPLGDTWELDSTSWRPVSLVVQPEARFGHVLGYHLGSRTILLHGGRADLDVNSVPFPETWILRYRSPDPAERCDNDLDDDRDGLTDCADPDCESRHCGPGSSCAAGLCQLP